MRPFVLSPGNVFLAKGELRSVENFKIHLDV